MFNKDVYFADRAGDEDDSIVLIPFHNQIVIDEINSVLKTHREVFNIYNYHYGITFTGRLGKHTVKLSFSLAIGDALRTDTSSKLLNCLAKTLDLFTSTKAEVDRILIDLQMSEKPKGFYTGIIPDLSLILELEHPTAINTTPFISAHLKCYTKLTKNYQNTLITIKAPKIINILQAAEENVLAHICNELKLTS